jgi:hypothetical protein
MPQAAIERGIVDQVLLPDEIGSALVHLDKRRKSGRAINATNK